MIISNAPESINAFFPRFVCKRMGTQSSKILEYSTRFYAYYFKWRVKSSTKCSYPKIIIDTENYSLNSL